MDHTPAGRSSRSVELHRELRFLIAAVVLMLVGVVASLAILARGSRVLSTAHAHIVDNASPSIVALDDAQARLRRVHLLLLERQMSTAAGAAVQDASIAAARHELDRDVEDYLRLPTDPGEVPFQNAIRESLAQVNLVADRVLAAPPGATARDPMVRHELEEGMTRLGLELARASEFNAQLAQSAAAGVVGVSATTLPLAAGIELLTFLAAAATLVLTYRAVRRAEALWATSRAALDRRAEELELFSARVAHDLLSPLATVTLAMDLAGRRLTDPEDATAHNAVARATRTLSRIGRFVSDLLEFARAGAKPTPGARASVEDVLQEIADEFTPVADDAGVDLRVEPEHVEHDVACSPGVLTSVLANLVQNAIKYLGDSDVRRVSIRAAEHHGEVRVEVEDTGPGIAPADRDKLFDPYARGRDAKAPGLGLGLATVRRLVESHGGNVGVQSAAGRGSVFWFSLPAAA